MSSSSTTTTSVNYCSSDLGAKIVECCSNSANAEGILVEREDSIWSAKAEGVVEKPFVTIQLPPHPAIRFIGWHVWQDYSSNPKVVEVSAGMSPNALTDVVHCTALQGPGVQLWELSTPISSAYSFIRFRIVATFGSASTYMNRVFAFSIRPPEPNSSSVVGSHQNTSMLNHSSSYLLDNNNSYNIPRNSFSQTSTNNHFQPSTSMAGINQSSFGNPNNNTTSRGNSYASNNNYNNNNNNASSYSSPPRNQHQDPIRAFETGSPMHMSEMLKELDDDIRLLHPLHVEGLVAKTAAAASRSQAGISGRPTPTVSPSNQQHQLQQQQQPQIADYSFNNNNNSNNNNTSSTSPSRAASGSASGTGGGGGAVAVVRHSEIEELRREIAELRGRVQQQSSRSNNASPTRSSSANTSSHHHPHLNHDELSAMVDDILQPKLLKWSRKLETRILMKVDETLKDLLGQITAAIDGRVEQHMRHVLREHHREHGIELCHLCGPHHNHNHNSNNNSKRKSFSASATASSTNNDGARRKSNATTGSSSAYQTEEDDDDDDDDIRRKKNVKPSSVRTTSSSNFEGSTTKRPTTTSSSGVPPLPSAMKRR